MREVQVQSSSFKKAWFALSGVVGISLLVVGCVSPQPPTADTLPPSGVVTMVNPTPVYVFPVTPSTGTASRPLEQPIAGVPLSIEHKDKPAPVATARAKTPAKAKVVGKKKGTKATSTKKSAKPTVYAKAKPAVKKACTGIAAAAPSTSAKESTPCESIAKKRMAAKQAAGATE